MKFGIKVSSVMADDVVTSHPSETLSKVISKMSEKTLHELPIVDKKNKLMGYFSFDMLMKRRHAPIYTKISNLMTAPPKIDEGEDVFEAARLMLETGFRALPVVDKANTLKGIISRTDLIKIVPKLNEVSKQTAGEIMTPEPMVLSGSDGIEKALELMLALGEISAPVVDKNGKISGSVLIDEISRAMWYEKDREGWSGSVGEKSKASPEVRGFVSSMPVAKEDDSLKSVCEKMSRMNPYICIVADDAQKPIGVITQYDILKKLVKYTLEKGVYMDITGLEVNDPFVYASIFSKVERFVQKVGKFSWITLYTLNFHVKDHNKGGKIKWSIRAKLKTDKGLFYVKTHSWDLLKCVDEIVMELNKRISHLKFRRADRILER